MIKILTPNKDGKFEFTKAELEKLLSETEKEGFEAGFTAGIKQEQQKQQKGTIVNVLDTDNKNNFGKPITWPKDATPLDIRFQHYVDYENLPKYDDEAYEKIPYWMRPDFKMPVITCTPIWKVPDLASTGTPPDKQYKVTTCFNNSIGDTSTINKTDHTITTETGTYDRYGTTKQRQDDAFKYSKKVIMNK